jgi:hypothetical protein
MKNSWTPEGKLERRSRHNTQVNSCIIRDDDDDDDDDGVVVVVVDNDELLGTSVSTLKPTDKYRG